MPNKTLPVYNIKDFHYSGIEGGFYANTFSAHLKEHQHFILAPHRHDFYVSMLYTKGAGVQEIDFNSFEIKPGTIFMLCPGQVNAYTGLSNDIEGYIIFHTKNFFDLNFSHQRVNHFPFFSSLHNSPLILLQNIQNDKIEPLYCAIYREYKADLMMQYQKLPCLVNVLYIELFRLYLPIIIGNTKNLKYLNKLTELETALDSNFKEKKYPKEYAKMMNISERHLNRICKSCLNKTTSDIITERVILEAKRVLIFFNKTVSEIAAELGYFDNSYFSRLFKKKCGKTPLQFLKAYRKE